MGKGCVLEAARRWPVLRIERGTVWRHGELPTFRLTHLCQRVWEDTRRPYHLLALLVKPCEGMAREVNLVRHQPLHGSPGAVAPSWAAMADRHRIVKSGHELMRLTDRHRWQTV
jgi:hypothetical protein